MYTQAKLVDDLNSLESIYPWLKQAVTRRILCNATFTYTDRKQFSLDYLYLVKEEIQISM